MGSDSFPLDEYHTRIGVSAGNDTGVERLRELQRAQLYSIPYENFDILLGRGADLSPDHLVDKMVRSQRGGYCFELNSLFLAALKAEGFDVRPLLGRVHLSGEPTGRGHQLELVTISGKQWIADVGAGRLCPCAPMPLEDGAEITEDGRHFRMIEHELGFMIQYNGRKGWADQYSFDLTPVVPNDIAYGNHFTSTHPSSFFTSARIAVLNHPDGHTIVFNFDGTINRGGEKIVETLRDDATYLDRLRDLVGIELDANYEDLEPIQHFDVS